MITRTELVDYTNLIKFIQQMEEARWAVRLIESIGNHGYSYLVVFEMDDPG
jgi:hypothetical protein